MVPYAAQQSLWPVKHGTYRNRSPGEPHDAVSDCRMLTRLEDMAPTNLRREPVSHGWSCFAGAAGARSARVGSVFRPRCQPA
ncbi:hypothetical protein GZL_06860 [Streptomyces sp. 769]|nr:hypothetical protein GZL_06860 [Streptomyces sp. 769]